MGEKQQDSFKISECDVEAVRPLRMVKLHPEKGAAGAVYQSDEDPTARHFCARDADGEVVGIGSLQQVDRVAGQGPFGSPGLRLRGLAVVDSWRGKGIGAALVAHMVEVGVAAGCVEAWANARRRNLRFFERNQFQLMSGEFEVTGVGLHVVVARKL